MAKYRKKPVVIEAIQFNGTPESANIVFDRFFIPGAKFVPSSNLLTGEIKIPTLEGVMTANAGDFIIKGVNGEFYPYKPDIFEKTYELADESSFTEGKNLSFGKAIEAAKLGHKVAREGWNGSGMFAYYVPAAEYPAMTGIAKEHFGENAMVPYREYWALKTAQGDIATWAPSGSDSLADDWMIINY